MSKKKKTKDDSELSTWEKVKLTPKVGAMTLTLALSTIVLYLANDIGNLDMPEGVAAAIVFVLTVAAGWFKKD